MATCVFDFSSLPSSCPIFVALYPFSLSAFSNACRSGIQSPEIRARGYSGFGTRTLGRKRSAKHEKGAGRVLWKLTEISIDQRSMFGFIWKIFDRLENRGIDVVHWSFFEWNLETTHCRILRFIEMENALWKTAFGIHQSGKHILLELF